MDTVYNGDKWISHFQCMTYTFNIVYTHRVKSESMDLIEYTLELIKNQYGRDVRYIRLDGETSLASAFNQNIARRGIKVERTAPDTPAQNGGSERIGWMLVIKARMM